MFLKTKQKTPSANWGFTKEVYSMTEIITSLDKVSNKFAKNLWGAVSRHRVFQEVAIGIIAGTLLLAFSNVTRLSANFDTWALLENIGAGTASQGENGMKNSSRLSPPNFSAFEMGGIA